MPLGTADLLAPAALTFPERRPSAQRRITRADAVTSQAFSRPEEWIGRAMALAADELTPVRIAAFIESTLGPYVQVRSKLMRALNEGFAFANE
ncbi:hypothetical protein AB0L10_40215 [Streptomyces flaveolus]|uniref:hypothetical protein n=1 Tax=Streptomyces flaveolus TaxID=67297 RepID=UPI00341A763F